MAVKYLAGERLIGTAAEREALTVNTEYTATPDSTPNNFATMTLDGSSTPEVLTQSITQVSNSVFYCRFKVVFGSYGTNSYSFVSLTDTTARSNESIDSLGVMFRNDSGGNKWGVHTIAGANIDSVDGQDFQTWSPTNGTAYYFEIIRETSGHAFVINYGTDSTYQTKVSTSETCSVSSSCTGLKYVGVRDHASSNSNSTITVTDVKIYSSDSLESSADGSNVGSPTSGDTSPTPPSGLGSSSFYFDGNDAIDIDGAVDFSTTVGSVSLWFYNDGTSESKIILGIGDADANSQMIIETKTNGIMTKVRHNSGTYWEIRRNSSNNGGALSTGWHHIAVSQDGTAVKVYVDGTYINTDWDNETDKSKWILSELDTCMIGCINKNNLGNRDFFTGNVMEVGFWNVALTSTQVSSLYGNGGSTAKKANTEPTGLRAYYPLSGTTVTNGYNIPLGNNPSADIYASQGGANEGYILSRDGGEDWRYGSTSTATSGGNGKNIKYVKFGIKKTGTFSDNAKFECVIMDGNGNSPTNESTNVVATGTLVSQTGMTITGSPTQLVGSMFDSSDWVWVKWQFDDVELLNSYRIVFRAMDGVITSNSHGLHLNWTSGACGSGGVQSSDGWNYSASSSGTPQNTWGTGWKINMLALTGTTTYPNLTNGAIFEESDTGKHYMFDGTSAWNEVT